MYSLRSLVLFMHFLIIRGSTQTLTLFLGVLITQYENRDLQLGRWSSRFRSGHSQLLIGFLFWNISQNSQKTHVMKKLLLQFFNIKPLDDCFYRFGAVKFTKRICALNIWNQIDFQTSTVFQTLASTILLIDRFIPP